MSVIPYGERRCAVLEVLGWRAQGESKWCSTAHGGSGTVTRASNRCRNGTAVEVYELAVMDHALIWECFERHPRPCQLHDRYGLRARDVPADHDLTGFGRPATIPGGRFRCSSTRLTSRRSTREASPPAGYTGPRRHRRGPLRLGVVDR